MSEPSDSDNAPSEGAEETDPAPSEPDGALGFDDAWSELSPAGRVAVVGSAVLLLFAAAIGVGVGLASGGDDGDGTAVIAETAGPVVTLEVPSATETVPVETVPPTTTTDPFDEETVPDETTGESLPDDSAPTEESPTGEILVFTEADGPEIGTVSITEPSEVTWTSEGTTFVLLDVASGATLVDAVDSEGLLTLEVGEYDLQVEADGAWTITIRPR